MIRPTPAELATIRKIAQQIARRSFIKIEVGERFALDDCRRASINILEIDDTDRWEKSDLNETRDWSVLRKGIPSQDGRAVVDFYVYERPSLELSCNIAAEFEGGRLVRIFNSSAIGDPTLWTK